MLRADFPQIPIWPLMMPLAQMLCCAACTCMDVSAKQHKCQLHVAPVE